MMAANDDDYAVRTRWRQWIDDKWRTVLWLVGEAMRFGSAVAVLAARE